MPVIDTCTNFVCNQVNFCKEKNIPCKNHDKYNEDCFRLKRCGCCVNKDCNNRKS